MPALVNNQGRHFIYGNNSGNEATNGGKPFGFN